MASNVAQLSTRWVTTAALSTAPPTKLSARRSYILEAQDGSWLTTHKLLVSSANWSNPSSTRTFPHKEVHSAEPCAELRVLGAVF